MCLVLDPHSSRLGTVMAEGRCDMFLAFLVGLWTVVPFPAIFGIGTNNLQSIPEHKGGPQKVFFNFLKIISFSATSQITGENRNQVGVLLSSVQLSPGNKLSLSELSLQGTKGADRHLEGHQHWVLPFF